MASAAKKVLLIDDSPTDTFLVQRIMRDYPPLAPQNVVILENITDAKEYIKANGENISLILLDLNLPDTVDGLDSYSQIKATNVAAPVIALTSLEDRDLAVELIGQGLEDFVCKSDILYSPRTLGKSIDFALSRNVQKETSVRSLMRAMESKDSLLESMGAY